MVSKLFAALILFFQPEDSCSLANKKIFPTACISVCKKKIQYFREGLVLDIDFYLDRIGYRTTMLIAVNR